ncbi:hypothetical protein PVAND_009627 [Polypedilum vanderplanki]|uniref:RFX-type winged-helix domain-containing protein n=1 Tax=Polypedilum vanderplanki TaxID=319348 RepID=A0A9J6CDU7_POLVA|nr:hypothetical protein PVAND_009627 [Polypedilum vanderplanki]
MTFQPWKQAFNNLPNQFYRKSESSNELPSSTFSNNKIKNGDEIPGASISNLNSILSHSYDVNNDSQHSQQQQTPLYQSSLTSPNCSNNNLTQIDSEQQQQQPVTNKLNGTKFSIFSQLLNLNKINAFDNILVNASLSIDDDDDFTGDKRQGMRKLMEQAISDEAKQQIAFILEKISTLRPAEKLLLYLKMPGGHCEVDPLKQSQNPLGSRSEISHTINWVRSHLEQDDKVSIPKQEVYEDYVSFCGKISIKPLSTADFGKVMKQVFPDIRPRRLGTRGHSRYCYAAMRKATKLASPHLPDLTITRSELMTKSKCDDKESSWNVIKNWSENLLGTHFESLDDLANHIEQSSNLTSPSTSKQALQKKLMQRDGKDKNKRNNNQTIRRRRKKRRTSTTTSSPEHTPDYFSGSNTAAGIHIKQEKETDGSAIENNDDHSENSSDVPMNLSNTEQSKRMRNEQIAVASTNTLAVSNMQFFDNDVKSKLKNKLMPQITTAAPVTILEPPNEQKQDENQYNVLCKKVRQAQQMKMSAAAINANSNNNNTTPLNLNIPTTSTSTFNNISPVINNLSLETQSSDSLLKSSSKRKPKRDTIQMMKRPKMIDKLADEASACDSPLTQVESNDLVKGDLKEDFILPRERFISICNMDRNALDTYLNNSEENSQDLELLQYFSCEDKNRNNEATEVIEEDLGPVTTSVPLLENYQLSFNEANSGNKNDKQNEKILQLRSMIEEKYNAPDSVIKNLLLKNPPQQQQQQQQPQQQVLQTNINDQTELYPMSLNMSQKHLDQTTLTGSNFHMNASASVVNSTVPQSPNTRRKNFSFVPIPTQSSRVKNINQNPIFKTAGPTVNETVSPFVSPRVTPINCKQPQIINVQSPNSLDTSKNIPVLGTNNNTAFCRPTQFKVEPNSAPPSPSMVNPNFTYSPQAHQQNQFQFNPSIAQQQQPQGTGSNNYNYPVESRSQSVPPHCTNNNSNNGNSVYGSNGSTFNNFSSACSSMAPTPAPSDYQEFSDTSILDIFNNEQPPLTSSIKMESNGDVISELLETEELLNQNSNTSDGESLLVGALRQNFNSISRSVPSTPLPYHATNGNYNNNNNRNMNSLNFGKSVPNTPIATVPNNPFRYSPELQRTRDFLINGFNNNVNHNNNVINNKQMGKTHDAAATIDELDSNLLNSL